MKKTITAFTALMLLFFFGGSLHADQLGAPVRKKIIEFGWDNPKPEYLDRNLEEIETYVPHDGMGIDVSKIITLPNGKKISTAYYNFTKIPYQKEWYEADIGHLKKVHARARHLKHNFINTTASSFTGEFDLFDDEFWDIVCQKFAIFAWMARQSGCAGIRFDLEDYGNQALWSYRPSCGHSFREAWEKARSRGRQWMNAMIKEYPDITLFCFFWLDLMMGYGDDSPMRFEQLESCSAGLLVAFINGIYDVLPPEAKIVDGMESYGYGAHTLSDYLRMRALREERFPKLLTAENRLKFLAQGSFACATYMDAYIAEKGSFQKYRNNENMTMSGFFRRNFTWAVQYSDEYVWTWTECRKWFPCEYRHAWQKNILKKSPTVPGPYVGMAIPGMEDAMSYARDPWKYAFNLLKESKNLKNLLKNPDFEGPDGKLALKPAPDSVFYKKLPNWSTWQNKRSKGTFSLAAGQGIGGSNAILLKGVTGGCAHQGIKIDPNGAYIIRASAKIINQCGASLGAQWRDPQGKWCNHSMNMAVPFTEDLGNGWKRATLVIRNIPEKTQYLNVMLNSRAGNAEDAALFDNVEVFSIFEKEPAVAPHLKDALEKWRKDFAAKQPAEVLKNGKKSPPVPGNRVINGGFQMQGEAKR